MATTAPSQSPSPSPWGKPGGWALDSEKQDEEEHRQPLPDFPSLSTAAVTKTKKKKPQTLSLAEFTTGKPVTHGSSSSSKGLTTDELSVLPTGPRERSADEIQNFRSGGGGGFKSYSSNSSDNNRRSEEDSSSRWGSSFNRDSRDNTAPSRADEVDDWGAAKKSAPPAFNSRDRPSSRPNNGTFFFDSHSRADDSDTWLAKKSFVPSERKMSGGGFGSNKREGDQEATTARPRLVLQPRSLPVPDSNGDQPVAVTKVNPFGAARPREQVLADKGQDWKKIDEKLESVKIEAPVSSERSWRKTDPHTPREEEEKKPWKQERDAEILD